MEMSDLAWAAELIDGEEYVDWRWLRQRSGNRYRYPSITVSMTCPVTVRRLHSIFGIGSLFVVEPRVERHLEQLRWMVVNRDALFVAEHIHEFSVTKRVILQQFLDHYARLDF